MSILIVATIYGRHCYHCRREDTLLQPVKLRQWGGVIVHARECTFPAQCSPTRDLCSRLDSNERTPTL